MGVSAIANMKGNLRKEMARSESMAQQTLDQVTRSWTTRRDEKRQRMQQVQTRMKGPVLPNAKIVEAFESLIVSGDRVVLEGDNQKQADFLSRSLIKVDPG